MKKPSMFLAILLIIFVTVALSGWNAQKKRDAQPANGNSEPTLEVTKSTGDDPTPLINVNSSSQAKDSESEPEPKISSISKSEVTKKTEKTNLELEKIWLSENGFPKNSDYFRRFNHLNELQMRKQAESGDQEARIALAHTLHKAGRHEEARSILLESVADGSVFALHELAFLTTPTDGSVSPYAFAYLQAAVALGDVSIVPRLSGEATLLSREDYALSQILFANLMMEISNLRMTRNGSGLITTVRPVTLISQ